jgi:uncharacterized RDD family membrane protein YckC
MCRQSQASRGNVRLATPGQRLGATFLDAIIPYGVLFYLAFMMGNEPSAAAGVVAALGFLGYIVYAIVLFAQGTTPGKRILAMTVVTEDGGPASFLRMLGREWIGKWISAVVFFLGYLWILFDPERQGWHDKLMSTWVVEG